MRLFKRRLPEQSPNPWEYSLDLAKSDHEDAWMGRRFLEATEQLALIEDALTTAIDGRDRTFFLGIVDRIQRAHEGIERDRAYHSQGASDG